MLGMHGTYRANMAMTHCDLILAVGARFDDRVTGKIDEFAPDAKIVHIDIDPTSISKNVRVDVPIVGDAKTRPEEDARPRPGRGVGGPRPGPLGVARRDRGVAGRAQAGLRAHPRP